MFDALWKRVVAFIQMLAQKEFLGLVFMKGLLPFNWLFLREKTRRTAITSLLNYKSYDADRGLYHNHDSVGFAIVALPTAGLGMQEIRTLEGIFTNTYKAGTVLQVILHADPNVDHIIDRWADARGVDERVSNPEVFRMLARRRADYLKKAAWQGLFHDESLLMRDYHLIITCNVPKARGQDELSRADLDELERHRSAVLGVLRSAQMQGESMTPDMIINMVGDIFRPKLDPAEPRERIPYDPAVELREQIVPDETAVYVGRDNMTIDWRGNRVSVMPYSVKQYPAEWSASLNGELLGPFFNRVQRIASPVTMSLLIHVPDQVSAMSMAKQKLLRATQMRDSPVGKYVPAWIGRQQDWKFVVAKMEQGSKLLQVAFNIALYSKVGEEETAEQSLKSVFSSMGWRLAKTRFAVLPRFFATLPLVVGREAYTVSKRLRFFRSMLSWNCVNIAPWIGEWKGNVPSGQDPSLLFVGRRGQLCYVDPFQNSKGNYNIAVAAASGSGKSVFTQDYLMAFLGTGGRAFVIDSGRSYENMCKLLGGEFIDFSKMSNPNLNPFTTIIDRDAVPEEVWRESPNTFSDQLPILRELIGTMADPYNPMPAKHSALLADAITQAWQQKKNKATITTVGELLASSEHQEARDIAIMLRPYMAGGGFAEYFEGDANIDFRNNFVVLELDDLSAKGDLQAIVVLLLMKRITEVMYLSGRKQKKICIIDEAWRFLTGGGGAARMIEEGYRTARKYNGSFMTITQGIPDYYKSPTTIAAYVNSDFTFILRQKPESLAEVKNKGYLVMNEWEERTYRSIDTFGPSPEFPTGKYSEISIKSPGGMAVGLLCLDPMSASMMSTKAADVEAIKALEKQGYSKLEALEKVVEQRIARV